MRRLHDLGFAHSFEVWSADGRLIGGGYGIAIGRVFYTESQFSRESNTSKMGFASLNHHLAKWGFVLNDGKDFTPTIDAMGFRAIPRAEFEAMLREHGTFRRAQRVVEGRSRPGDHRRLNGSRDMLSDLHDSGGVSTYAE